MEKFGIFELLDTLSALMAEKNGEEKREENVRPRPEDAVFSPPSYPSSEENGALLGLLDKHDKISRRIDKKS